MSRRMFCCKQVAPLAALLLVCLLPPALLWAALEEPISVEGGRISGTPSWGWGVRMYRGIPFAAPPVGALRWRSPQPVVPWQGVRAAQRFAPSCMQRQRPPFEAVYNDGTSGYSEDCLYLNVWTPARSAGDRLPVMVWIYGGGGVEGSGSEGLYDGNGLARQGVVVVTFNYRVNVFGWLVHPELSAESAQHRSGNYGALDQIAALTWVKKNVAAFGGDPGRVTVFGESGGSRSVNWLMASPLARGLFQRAIGESHTVFGRMLTLAEAEAQGASFAGAAGATSLAALRALPAEDLHAAYARSGARMTGAIVDGGFLPEDVAAIFASGKQNDVALLTGATNDETGALDGGGRERAGAAPQDPSAYREWASASFGEQAAEFLALYPAATDAEVKRAHHDALRDANFTGHRTWAKLQASHGKSPAYLYLFSHAPALYAEDGATPTRRGAPHGAEILFVFHNLRYADRPWTDVDRKVADATSAYWVNFAKTGDPNGAGLVRWPVYDPVNEKLLNIGEVVRAEAVNAAALDFLAARIEQSRRAAGSREGGE